MKILYHHRIASKDGQFVHIEELINALTDLGHEVMVIGPKAVGQASYGYDNKFVKALKSLIPKVIYEILELSYNVVAYLRLTQSIKKYHPDILYERYNLYLIAGALARRRLRLPMLLEVNAPLYEERRKYQGIGLDWMARWSEQFAWSSADKVLTVTGVLARRIQGQDIPGERIHVIPNGINKERFTLNLDREQAKEKHGLAGKLVIGFTGFVREWHGLENIVDFIQQSDNRQIHLLLVGDGPARSALTERAANLGVAGQVTITGFAERGAIPEYVRAFDIAVQPDVVDYASPLKLFEYMVMECAIVAPAKPNIEEVLRHNYNAMLFDAEDKAEMFSMLRALIEDSELRFRLGRCALESIDVQELTWRKNAQRVIELAQGSISNKHENAVEGACP